MTTERYELEHFKRTINLSEFAAAHGYLLDRQHSSQNSVAMKGNDGDKIVIARDESSQHWIYFSVSDTNDHGTIIDFLNYRKRTSLGVIRKELRPWLGTISTSSQLLRPQATRFQKNVTPIQRDRAAVLAQFAAATPLTGNHNYLEQARDIPESTLNSARFTGRIYTDKYNNAIFPHHDRQGVCGFEIRNYQFKGFAKGGEKGLWYSNAKPDDTALVITESAIDGLSYHALHLPDKTRYFSIAGEMNPMQRNLLASAMQKLPRDGSVIIATDHDSGGQHLTQRINDIAATTGRDDLNIIEHRPPKEGQDWNAVLKANTTQQTPT